MKHIIADLHCHPTLKPFGNCFTSQHQSFNTNFKGNIYYYDPQTFWDKIKNRLLGLTNFRQSDFTSLKYGGVNLIFCSMYPLEKGFCRTNQGNGQIMDAGLNLVTGLSKERIDFIQDLKNGYFSDLESEYEFLLNLNGKEVEIDGKKVVYNLIKKATDLKFPSIGPEEIQNKEVFIINVFLSIEGAHVLYSNFADIGKNSPDVKENLMANITKLKSWEYCPAFITFSHHFWNGFAGHEISLTDPVVMLTANQSYHQTDNLNSLGREVIIRLLNNQGERRIFIDIKHMNEITRKEYLRILEQEYTGQKIPVIISHGGVRGNRTNKHLFCDEPINFSDEEIIAVGRSEGLFGIQFDERRIASKAEIHNFKRYYSRTKVLYHAAELVWRQIQHIVEVLDNADMYAWSVPCIGSDNDGIVNALDGIWTSEDFTSLQDYLLMHAFSYVKSEEFRNLKNPYNRKIDQEEILYRFMGSNVYDFIHRNLA